MSPVDDMESMNTAAIKELAVNHQGSQYVILEYEEELKMQGQMYLENCESDDVLQNMSDAVPVVMRNKRNAGVDRSNKCISVVVEPSGVSWKKKSSANSSRRSMYELRTGGWIFDELKNSRSVKNNLNLDGEINSILNDNSSVNVTLGNIKLTF